MFKRFTIGLSSTLGLLTPALAFAQTGQNILNVVDLIALIMNRVVGIAIIIALFWFIWGLVGYIADSSDDAEKGRAKGRERMIMGTIAFFVIVSIWGLVRFLQTSFGLGGDKSGNLQNDEIPYVGEEVRRQ